MITYNEAKQLLNQGIFPCLVDQDGNVDYITSYSDLSVTTLSNQILYASSEDSKLNFYQDIGGGTIIK